MQLSDAAWLSPLPAVHTKLLLPWPLDNVNNVGRAEYSTAGGGSLVLNAWHQDQVVQVPQGAICLAGNAFCENAILAYGDRVFTVQPHPEFSNELIADYVDILRGTGDYPDDRMDLAKDATLTPVENARLATSIARFFLTRSANVDA